MISNNNQNDNSLRPLICLPKSYCRHGIQEYIDDNNFHNHPRWAPFTREAVSIALHELKTTHKHCWRPSKSHIAVLRYLHNFLCPTKGWGYCTNSAEVIGSMLNNYGHKKLNKCRTYRILNELEIMGYISRIRRHKQSCYMTYLTTLGYAVLVDKVL